jgi:putative FmdB family regulatory protein
MPTYAYRCQSCSSEFEKFQKFAEKPVSKCPVCGKGPVRRLLQPAAIVFKGSGWYATDHRSPSGNGTSKSEKGDKPEKGEKGEKSEKADKGEKVEKTESASAAKSDGDSKPSKKESKASSSDN